jgi:hypothetical protein
MYVFSVVVLLFIIGVLISKLLTPLPHLEISESFTIPHVKSERHKTGLTTTILDGKFSQIKADAAILSDIDDEKDDLKNNIIEFTKAKLEDVTDITNFISEELESSEGSGNDNLRKDINREIRNVFEEFHNERVEIFEDYNSLVEEQADYIAAAETDIAYLENKVEELETYVKNLQKTNQKGSDTTD